MSDRNRLARIEANMEASRRTLRPPYITSDDADWLVAELKDLRTDLAVALSQLQDAVGEIARLRALLEPSVTMTSPHIIDPRNEETPADPRGERRAP